MAKEFIERESFKHKLAKELFGSWFTDQEKGNNDSCSVAQFGWRKNQGVHLELKFHLNDDPYYFENSEGLTNPEFDRGALLFVPDICIFHKGTPTMLFEVVCTNPVSKEKKKRIEKFFDGFHVEVYEIYADEILRYCEIPEHIEARRII